MTLISGELVASLPVMWNLSFTLGENVDLCFCVGIKALL